MQNVDKLTLGFVSGLKKKSILDNFLHSFFLLLKNIKTLENAIKPAVLRVDARWGWHAVAAIFHRLESLSFSLLWSSDIPKSAQADLPFWAFQLSGVSEVVILLGYSKASLNRFPIVQHLSRGMNRLRVQMIKQFDRKSHKYRALKRCWDSRSLIFMISYSNRTNRTRRALSASDDSSPRETSRPLL